MHTERKVIRKKPNELFMFDTFFKKRTGIELEDLPEEQKAEEVINLKNGFNFARKVMVTGECDVLILDEILGLVNKGIISAEDFIRFLENKDSEMDVIMTGWECPEQIKPYVDQISYVQNIKVDNSME